MPLGTVIQFSNGVGRLVSKGSGRYVDFTIGVCDGEPRQGSVVRYEATERRRGLVVADVVKVLDGSSGGAVGKAGDIGQPARPIQSETI